MYKLHYRLNFNHFEKKKLWIFDTFKPIDTKTIPVCPSESFFFIKIDMLNQMSKAGVWMEGQNTFFENRLETYKKKFQIRK